MGYTHYWGVKRSRKTAKKDQIQFEKACIAISKALHTYQKTVSDDARLSGYSAHTKPGSYGGIRFNGKGDLSHEDFSLPEYFKENEGGFCKTANKPYDTAVVAALILLKHYMGDAVGVSSDGDAAEWLEGLRLAKTVCPSAKIPDTIRGVPLKALRA